MTTTPAILNRMRLNNSRLNYYQPHVYLTINGTRRETSTLLGRYATITKGRGPDGSRASLRVKNFTPSVGQSVVIGVGTLNNRLFGGVIQAIDQPKNETVSTPLYDLTCVGYRWLLDRRQVFRAYANASGDSIIRDLVATYSSGFTTAHVQPLATIASVVFDGVTIGEALDRLKTLIDGFDWYVDDYQDLHAFTGTELLVQPGQVTGSTIDRDYGFFRTLDLSQVRTRVYVAGQSTRVVSDVATGATSVLVANGTGYSASGGKARVGGQLLTYSGTSIGTASAPTVALGYYDGANVTAVSSTSFTGGSPPPTGVVNTSTPHGLLVGDAIVIHGNSLDTNGPRLVSAVISSTQFQFTRTAIGAPLGASGGYYRRCVIVSTIQTRGAICTFTFQAAHGLIVGQSFWVGFSGNLGGSYPYNGWQTVRSVVDSTTVTITMSGHPADGSAASDDGTGGHTFAAAMLPGHCGALTGTYSYKQTASADGAESLASAVSSTVSPAQVAELNASASFSPTSGGSLTASSTYYYGFSAVTDEGETPVTAISVAVNLGVGQTAVTIGLNASWFNDTRVKSINVWRTQAGSSQTIANLRYVGTFATPTSSSTWSTSSSSLGSFSDTVADTSRGGPVPSSNTTGGSVAVSGLAVSTNARTNQRTIYRNASAGTTYRAVDSVSNNVDTGVMDTASDASQADGATEPTAGQTSLTGIPVSGAGAITAPIARDADARPVEQRDDTAAQAVLAALEGGDGIHEHLLDRTDTTTAADLQAAGDADLARFSSAVTEVRFATRESHFVPGVTASLNVASPNAATGDFIVQSVTITDLELTMAKYPLRQVNAADAKFSLTDVLRQVPLAS